MNELDISRDIGVSGYLQKDGIGHSLMKTNVETHWASTVIDVDTLAPRVLAVHVTAVEVDVRRLVRVGDGVFARQDQRVETDGTLRPTGVDLGNLLLQLSFALKINVKDKQGSCAKSPTKFKAFQSLFIH